MVNFKDYLKEAELNELAWQTDSLSFYMGVLGIPLTPKQIKSIYGENIVTAYHITDINHAINLPKTGKTKRSVSSFTNMDKNAFDNAVGGIRTDGGVVAEIKGNVVFKSPEDIMSIPDAAGRRWLNFGLNVLMNSENKFISNFSKKMYKVLTKELIKFLAVENQNQNHYQSLVKELNSFTSTNLNNSIAFNEGVTNLFTDRHLTKKQRSGIYKKYIDFSTTLLKKHKISFKKIFFNQEANTNHWNEILINSFEVTKVYIFSDDYVSNYYRMTYGMEVNEIYNMLSNKGLNVEITTVAKLHTKIKATPNVII